MKKARHFTPRVNGKAENFINTLLEVWVWVYVMSDGSLAERNDLLPTQLQIDTGRRCPMAPGGLTPKTAARTVAGAHRSGPERLTPAPAAGRSSCPAAALFPPAHRGRRTPGWDH